MIPVTSGQRRLGNVRNLDPRNHEHAAPSSSGLAGGMPHCTLARMRASEWVLVITFTFLTLLAWIRPLGSRAMLSVTAIGVSAVGLIFALQWLDLLIASPIALAIRDSIPAPLMMVCYWQAGLFFSSPNPRLQHRFDEIDRRITSSFLWTRGNRARQHWIESYLELGYLLCYPMVPLGIAVLYLTGRTDYIDRYWIVVLLASCVSYAMVPFIQVLPPRLIAPESNPGQPGIIRGLNLWLLNNASIQANTFPSAHVGSTLSASLVLIEAVPLAGFVFLGIAVVIVVGSVTRRYHYAIDSLAGAAIAVVAYVAASSLW